MRHLAGSLLTGLLLHFSPLQAQKNLLLTSLDTKTGFDFPSEFTYLYTESLSDTANLVNKWDFGDWDRKTFNPHKKQDLTEPFYLIFTDVTFAFPVGRKMVVTSRYGWRDGQLHRGIDLDLVTGDEVYAMLDGKVRYARSHAGHGKTIVIRHANGMETIYAHLSKLLVEENQRVVKGELIGKGGTTGNARGSHLHLEVRYQGVTINPEYFFDFEGDSSIRAISSWITEEVSDPRRFSSTKKPTIHLEMELSGNLNDPQPVGAEKINEELVGLVEIPSQDEKQTLPLTYTIRYGDTLYSLAKKHQLTVEKICQLNKIKDSFKIQVGQKIILQEHSD